MAPKKKVSVVSTVLAAKPLIIARQPRNGGGGRALKKSAPARKPDQVVAQPVHDEENLDYGAKNAAREAEMKQLQTGEVSVDEAAEADFFRRGAPSMQVYFPRLISKTQSSANSF